MTFKLNRMTLTPLDLDWDTTMRNHSLQKRSIAESAGGSWNFRDITGQSKANRCHDTRHLEKSLHHENVQILKESRHVAPLGLLSCSDVKGPNSVEHFCARGGFNLQQRSSSVGGTWDDEGTNSGFVREELQLPFSVQLGLSLSLSSCSSSRSLVRSLSWKVAPSRLTHYRHRLIMPRTGRISRGVRCFKSCLPTVRKPDDAT